MEGRGRGQTLPISFKCEYGMVWVTRIGNSTDTARSSRASPPVDAISRAQPVNGDLSALDGSQNG